MVSAINEHIIDDHHNKYQQKYAQVKTLTTKQEEHLLLKQSVDVSKEKFPNSFIATE